jgi:HSP20 family protein
MAARLDAGNIHVVVRTGTTALDDSRGLTPMRTAVERTENMHITTIPERTAPTTLLPSKWGWEDLFSLPWLENMPKSRLPEAFRTPTLPPVNVAETDKAFTIAVDLPGLEEKDIDVRLMGNQLTISAERRWEEEKKGREYHRVESQFGRFERSVTLPENVKLGAAEAAYRKGVLTITLPKLEPTPATKINVKAG